jgi:hypothetical protein
MVWDIKMYRVFCFKTESSLVFKDFFEVKYRVIGMTDYILYIMSFTENKTGWSLNLNTHLYFMSNV